MLTRGSLHRSDNMDKHIENDRTAALLQEFAELFKEQHASLETLVHDADDAIVGLSSLSASWWCLALSYSFLFRTRTVLCTSISPDRIALVLN